MADGKRLTKKRVPLIGMHIARMSGKAATAEGVGGMLLILGSEIRRRSWRMLVAPEMLSVARRVDNVEAPKSFNMPCRHLPERGLRIVII